MLRATVSALLAGLLVGAALTSRWVGSSEATERQMVAIGAVAMARGKSCQSVNCTYNGTTYIVQKCFTGSCTSCSFSVDSQCNNSCSNSGCGAAEWW